MERWSPVFKYLLFFTCLHSALALILVWVSPGNSYAGKTITPFIHVVKRGDTLSGIALYYKISVEQLRQWNSLRGDKIFEGQHLQLWPHSSPKWHIVRSGDTLSEIAIQFGVSVPSLRRLNDISKDRIYPGQKLRLRPHRAVIEAPMTHVVREGDTLWDIAQLYGPSVPDLKKLNDLTGNTITPGMDLRLTELPEKRVPAGEQFEYVVKKGDNLSWRETEGKSYPSQG